MTYASHWCAAVLCVSMHCEVWVANEQDSWAEYATCMQRARNPTTFASGTRPLLTTLTGQPTGNLRLRSVGRSVDFGGWKSLTMCVGESSQLPCVGLYCEMHVIGKRTVAGRQLSAQCTVGRLRTSVMCSGNIIAVADVVTSRISPLVAPESLLCSICHLLDSHTAMCLCLSMCAEHSYFAFLTPRVPLLIS